MQKQCIENVKKSNYQETQGLGFFSSFFFFFTNEPLSHFWGIAWPGTTCNTLSIHMQTLIKNNYKDAVSFCKLPSCDPTIQQMLVYRRPSSVQLHPYSTERRLLYKEYTSSLFRVYGMFGDSLYIIVICTVHKVSSVLLIHVVSVRIFHPN